MQGPTNRDFFNLSPSFLEELLELQETRFVCPGAYADKNKFANLQDIAAIECAGALNWGHRAVQCTYDLFSKAVNLSKSLLGTRTGDKSHALVENNVIFYKYTIWVILPFLKFHQVPSRLLELADIVLVLFPSKLDIDLFFVLTSSESIGKLVRWGSVQGNLAVSQV
jgi:hypothetical protein